MRSLPHLVRQNKLVISRMPEENRHLKRKCIRAQSAIIKCVIDLLDKITAYNAQN
jgi:hypothetical protein